MSIWSPEFLEFSVDDVIRGQGADPAIFRQRRPQLVEVAARAVEMGRPWIKPQLLYQWVDVKEFRHERLLLVDGNRLSGNLIAQHLGKAENVVLMVSTVGEEIEQHSFDMMDKDPLLALALDGVGSAAVEALANAACVRFEKQAGKDGLQSSIPLSPGMVGWDVGVGQPEIFRSLNGSEIGVKLTASSMMLPKKSLSMVLGFGKEMAMGGTTCDFCSMRETCNYRDHYSASTLTGS